MDLMVLRHYIPNTVLTLTVSTPSGCFRSRSFTGHRIAAMTMGKSVRRSQRINGKPSLPSLAAKAAASGVPLPPLDLTEDNVRQVLADARVELAQLFDTSVGITGEVQLSELDGPFVKISLKGRFWHKRSTVVARVGNYLKQRIPEILEVDIEDEKQLDDSPENF
ncbi:hypothetical protein SLA2020_294460 [Shorea laevis]